MITPTDLKEYKSSNPNSDGGSVSDVELVSGIVDNLFGGIEASDSPGTEYRKVFRKNAHESLPWQNVRSWLTSQPQNAVLSFGFALNDVNDNDGSQGNMTALSDNAVIAATSDGDDSDNRELRLIGEDKSGNYQTEVLTLNGNTEVIGKLTFSKLYSAYINEPSGAHGITITQGPKGTVLGTIAPDKVISFLWLDADSEASAMKHGDIESEDIFGLWYRLTWLAGVGAVSADSVQVKSEGDTN